MEFYYVKNWKRFQHYADRNPPWVKLHFEILSSPDWVMLTDTSRVLLISCMLIASRNEGKIPLDPYYFKRVAYLDNVPDFKPLIKCGFLVKVLAKDSYLQADARPETETEAYREETEIEKKKNTKKEKSEIYHFELPGDIPIDHWQDYLEMRQKIRKPMTDKAKQLAITKLHELRDKGYDMAGVLQQSVFNSWQGLFDIKGVTPTPPALAAQPLTADSLGHESEGLLKAFEHLKAQYGDAIFRSWLSPLRVKEVNCSKITLVVPTNFMREWIISHYQSDLNVAVRKGWPQITEIHIEVVPCLTK